MSDEKPVCRFTSGPMPMIDTRNEEIDRLRADLARMTAERDELAKVVEATATALREALKAVDECYVDTGHIRVSCTSKPRICIASAITKSERALAASRQRTAPGGESNHAL